MIARLAILRMLQCLLVAALLLVSGCGGNGAGTLEAVDTTAPDAAARMFPDLPALPVDDTDLPVLRNVSEEDNLQFGNEDWQHATPGADYNETNMILYGPPTEFGAWAIYRWSGFTNGLLPNSLTVDAVVDPGREYWILLSNYSFGKWQIVGPVTSSTFTYNFDLGFNFTSPGHSVYVALIADRQNAALIEKLNLRTDRDIDPPAPPQNLRAENIGSHSADILWDLNVDGDVLGYRLYRGPNDSFEPGDAGVTMLGELDFQENQFFSDGLTSETTYHYRVTAFDVAFNESRPSAPLTFDTLGNQPPVPDFTWTPGFVQVDREVSFDPSATTDDGDDVEHLSFQWDFENDGTIDTVTTGPEIVKHTYSQRRTYNCRLLVYDGEASDELVRSIQVSFRYDYFNMGRANGLSANLAAVDTDPATGRIAVGMNQGSINEVHYYHNGDWEVISLADTPGDFLYSVVVGPQRIAALTASLVPVNGNDQAIDWYVIEYNGTNWSVVQSGKSDDNVIASAGVACSPAGKYTAALVTAYIPPDTVIIPNFALHYQHQKTGGGFRTGTIQFGVGTIYPFAIQRSDAESYIAYTKNGIDLVETSDSAEVSTHEQDCGAVASIAMEESITSDGELTWVVAELDGDILWGDNFGAPNEASQLITPLEPPNYLLGLKPEGDNDAQFYWGGDDSTGAMHLRGFNSAGNGGAGENFDLGSGYELATWGFGGYLKEGDAEGVYFATQEDRDGELIGRFVSNGANLRVDTLYEPIGLSPAQGYSHPVIFPDGSLNVFAQQPFPTAIRGTAATLDQPPALDECGVDSFVIPNTACATGNLNEFLIGSVSGDLHLVLNRFDGGGTVGEETLIIPDARLGMLQRSLASGKTMVAYTQNNGKSVFVREWNGSGWEAAVQVHAGADFIMQLNFQARADGGWGVLYSFDDGKLWLAESDDGAVWTSPVLLSSEALHDYCSIGLGYDTDGDVAVAVERELADPGVWLGHRNSGEPGFNWEKLDDTGGSHVKTCNVFYENNEPVVFYYYNPHPDPGAGVRVLEKIDGEYSRAQFDFVFFDAPLGTAVDALGNIVFSGVFGNPASAVYVVIWR